MILMMPVFEYECDQCGVRSSHLLSSSSREAVACPSCSAKRLQRIVSRFSRGRSETARISEAADRLATADDSTTGQALTEVGRAYDEDLSETMTAMYEADQEGT